MLSLHQRLPRHSSEGRNEPRSLHILESRLEPLRNPTSARPRSRADLNRDRWIQGPECWPLHHETILLVLEP